MLLLMAVTAWYVIDDDTGLFLLMHLGVLVREAWQPSPRYIQEHLVVRDRDGRPPIGPLAVHCFCV